MRLAAAMIIAALCLGCSGSKTKKDKDENSLGLSLGKTVRVSKKGEIIERFDLNNDGKTDVVRVYRLVGPKGSQEKRLIRSELDINFDGKTDIWRFYDPKTGELRKVEMDLDFDGKIDSITHYQNGKIVLKEMDLNFDEKMDVWKYFKNGRLTRIERDTHGRGKVDTWIYYRSDGKIDRIGVDKDGDGKIDHWETTSTEKQPAPKPVRKK